MRISRARARVVYIRFVRLDEDDILRLAIRLYSDQSIYDPPVVELLIPPHVGRELNDLAPQFDWRSSPRSGTPIA
jgi:hypothetical protein